jgi:hypothetical protein
MAEADSKERLAKAGFDPMTTGVSDANSYFKGEMDRWGKMVTAVGFSN